MTAPMGDASGPVAIASVENMLASAYAMEVEAFERYEEFAAQMELHGNVDVARLFRKLADYERKHAEEIARDLGARGVAAPPRAALAAPGSEGLETASGAVLHYLMTPRQALEIALENELRAFAFFSELVQSAALDEVRRRAGEYAAEEQHHADLVRQWLARVPETGTDWDYDPDEPRMPE